jgi:hypothetical protein
MIPEEEQAELAARAPPVEWKRNFYWLPVKLETDPAGTAGWLAHSDQFAGLDFRADPVPPPYSTQPQLQVDDTHFIFGEGFAIVRVGGPPQEGLPGLGLPWIGTVGEWRNVGRSNAHEANVPLEFLDEYHEQLPILRDAGGRSVAWTAVAIEVLFHGMGGFALPTQEELVGLLGIKIEQQNVSQWLRSVMESGIVARLPVGETEQPFFAARRALAESVRSSGGDLYEWRKLISAATKTIRGRGATGLKLLQLIRVADVYITQQCLGAAPTGETVAPIIAAYEASLADEAKTKGLSERCVWRIISELRGGKPPVIV